MLYLPLNGTSTTTGALIGPANSSGQSITGLLSPLRTPNLHVDDNCPELHVISPASVNSRLLNTS